MPETEAFPGVETHYRGDHFAVLDAGAHALAWTPRNQLPVLWTSPLATFEPGVAVRGGVPVIFPWFGAGPDSNRRPAHGFARTAAWTREEVTDELTASGALVVRYALTEPVPLAPDGDPAAVAPCRAVLRTRFSPAEFQVALTVTNTGSNTGNGDFSYEAALHSYFAISGITEITVAGFDGCSYFDKVSGSEGRQVGAIRFAGETDRIYRHTGTAAIEDPGWGRRIVIEKQGSANTVVWNPGAAKGSALTDVGSHHGDFVCVEAANIGSDRVRLGPGESHTIAQTVRLA